jgi:hypothetical protein
MGDTPAALSVVTIASLGDMGYEVDLDAADDYRWPSAEGDFSFRFVGAPSLPSDIDLSDDRLALPLYELTPQGRLRLVRD